VKEVTLIYVALGMHKSGTTLAAQTLHLSDVNMVESDPGTSYVEGNKFERSSVVDVNRTILGAHEMFSLDIAPCDDELVNIDEGVRERMRSILQTCQQKWADWGFKDPRTCLTYPAWQTELPPHRIVVTYRPIEELWFQYQSYQDESENQDRADRLVRRWIESNERILRVLEATSMPFIVLNYSRLMREASEFARLQRFVGKSLVDCRKPQLYHGTNQEHPVLEKAKSDFVQSSGYGPEQVLGRLARYAESNEDECMV
jgi:hypothetical protein